MSETFRRNYAAGRPNQRSGNPFVVNRDPCFKCGVRGDIGCKHQEPSVPSLLSEIEPQRCSS